MIKRCWGKLNSSFWLSFAVVFAGTLVAYSYSLFHLLRSEILFYFLKAGSNDSVVSLFYNNMNRTTGASDTWLFRPLGTAVLAGGKVAFDFNSLAWHILSLALFMIAVWCMFRLLWRIRPGVLAILMTLFFSTMYASVNAVLYSQLISYLIFTALVLAGLYYLYVGVEDSKKSYPYIAMAFFFVSAFCYEVGIVLIPLSALYIWLRRRDTSISFRAAVLSLSAMFLAYLIIYGVFKFISPTTYQVAELGNTFSPQALLQGAGYTLYLPLYWGAMIVMPSTFSVFPVAGVETQSAGIGSDFPIWLMMLNAAAIIAIGYFAFPRGKDVKEKIKKAFPLMLGVAAFFFVVLVAFYRGNDIHTGIHYVIDTNITLGIFLAFVIPMAYYFIRPQAKHIKWVAIGLLFFVLLSGTKTFMLNYQVWQVEQPHREYLAQVGEFVDAHKGEMDFDFVAVGDSEVENNLKFNFPEVASSGEINLIQSHYLAVKYYMFWEVDNPKYVLTYDEQRGELVVSERARLLK